MDNGAQIINNGAMDMQSDFGIVWGGVGAEPRIVNNGAMIQSDMITSIYVAVENNGAINVLDEDLELRGPSTHFGGTIVVQAATGSASISFETADHTFDAGTAIAVGDNGSVSFPSGTATVSGSYNQFGSGSRTSISGGAVTFDGSDPVEMSFLALTSGILGGSADVIVTDSMFWSGGAMQGTGNTSVLDTVTMVINGISMTIDERGLDNAGTIVWLNGDITAIDPAEVYVMAGGMFEMRAADTFGGTGWLGGEGTFVKSGTGVTTIGALFTNSGTLDVQAGTFAATGEFGSSGAIQGTGTIDLTGATRVYTLSGSVNPGTSPGIITFSGDVPLGPGSAVNIELDGTTVGTEYDQVAISGLGTFNGNLTITAGFTPNPGDTFTVLTFGSRGNNGFANITGLELGSGIQLDTVWTDTSLSLVAIPAPTTVSWANASSGNWSDPANWNPARVPTAEDTVAIEIDGDYTVTLDASATVAVLVMGGASGTQTLSLSGQALTIDDQGSVGPNGVISLNGTLTGTGSVTVAGAINWSSGTLSGASTTTVQAGGVLNAQCHDREHEDSDHPAA
jgi:hypothetical protein